MVLMDVRAENENFETWLQFCDKDHSNLSN